MAPSDEKDKNGQRGISLLFSKLATFFCQKKNGARGLTPLFFIVKFSLRTKKGCIMMNRAIKILRVMFLCYLGAKK